MEFIVSEYIHAHPMALLQPEMVADDEAHAEPAKLKPRYDSLGRFFVAHLNERVGTIAAAFCPKPAIVRMSDFKTNEHAMPLSDRWQETKERQSMLRFRGAYRYSHPGYAAGFAFECAAIERVPEVMGLTTVRRTIGSLPPI